MTTKFTYVTVIARDNTFTKVIQNTSRERSFGSAWSTQKLDHFESQICGNFKKN